jgi:DNA-binding transcriptional MerR regulator
MPGPLTVGAAAAETGWSARMLRYLEAQGLVVPTRTSSGYRLYGLPELNRLRSLRELRSRFALELTDVAFARRLRREAELKREVDNWLAAADDTGSWVEWEQRKHERLLAA